MKQKRAVLTGFGGVDKLEIVETEVPEPGEDELLIRVETAGVAFADVMMRHGKYPGAPKIPFTPGYDVVGVVEKQGGGTAIPEGTRVAAMTQFGGYAQFVAVKEAGVAVVPDNVPPEKAVCLVLNYLTAYQMIHRTCALKAGDSLLVHSAAGGVGTAVLELGRHLELETYGTASASKHDLVRSLGGIPIDYKTDDFVKVIKAHAPNGLNAVFDPIGPGHFKRSQRVLKKDGFLVAYGGLGMHDRASDTITGGLMQFITSALAMKLFGVGIHFSFFGVSVRHPEITRTDLTALLALAAEGKLDPVISEVLPLNEVGKAHALLASGKTTGKIVLDCR